ncbi:MAG: permease prefix domain 1-containing protein [Planctomycetota bacterium]|nr:permease prefix domain 1-containing protein [Planctomycetota bacterium]
MNAWDDGAREIDAELEFHLAEATDELVAAGVPRDEARERALAQLGDIERWRTDCLRHRKGRRTMLVKLQWAAIAALVLALGFLGFRSSRAHQAQELELASLRAELAAERAAKAEQDLFDETALVVQRRLAAVGHDVALRRLSNLTLQIHEGQGVLGRLLEHQPRQMTIQLTPAPEIVIEESLPPVVPVSGGKPDDQR